MPRRGYGTGTPLTAKQKAQRSVAAKASAAKRKAHANHSIRRLSQQSLVKGHTATDFDVATKHYSRGDKLAAAADKGIAPKGKSPRPGVPKSPGQGVAKPQGPHAFSKPANIKKPDGSPGDDAAAKRRKKKGY